MHNPELPDTEVPHTEQPHTAFGDRAPTETKKKTRKPSMSHGLLDQAPSPPPSSLAYPGEKETDMPPPALSMPLLV